MLLFLPEVLSGQENLNSTQMKILQVIPYFWPALSFGGPAKVVYELSQELSKKNIVSVYTSDVWDRQRRIKINERIPRTKKLKVFYFRNVINSMAFRWRIFTNFGIISRYIEHKEDFDIIHINDVFSVPQILLAKIAYLNSKPYVISTHGVKITDIRRKGAVKHALYELFVKNMLYKAGSVIATSEGEAKVLRRLGLKNVSVVFNGISNDKFKVSKKFNKYYDPNILSILYIGRINVLKGLKELTDAVAKLKIPFQLLIAGPDDGLKKDLMMKIKRYGLEQKVHFLGFVNESQKAELYRISDVFVYPSKLEGFSISILEAMQNSLPVIITEACNFPDVKKYNAGLVLSVKDVTKKIPEYLEYYFARKNLLKIAGSNARKLILRKYSIEAMTNQMEEIYKESI